jgi:hypothetical protein
MQSQWRGHVCLVMSAWSCLPGHVCLVMPNLVLVLNAEVSVESLEITIAL